MALYRVPVARTLAVTANLNLFNQLSILLSMSARTLRSNY